MVHMSHGMPTDHLVYGRRTQQYYPKMNVRVGGAPQRSGGCQTTFNITNNYGPPKGIMIANTVIGGLGMLGNLFLSFMGLKRQQPVQQQASPYAQLNQQQGVQQKQATQNNELANLQKLFPKANIVENNGKFTATNADGNIIGKDLSYSEMIDALGKQQTEHKAEDSTVKTEVKENDIKVDEKEHQGNDNPSGTIDGGSRVTSKKAGGGSPAGWYRATLDKQSRVKGITIANLQQSESKAGKQTSAATYVLNQVLDTKMGSTLSPANKARLLGEIIRHNPSVFNADGTLKKDADIQKLDVPTVDWIKNKYDVKSTSTPGVSKKQTSMPVQRGNNGYYAQQAGPGGWIYYNPQGKQISGEEFQKHCPTIYKNTQH